MSLFMNNKIKEIVYLQAECLYLYSKKKKISLKDASYLFNKYHIFEYIFICYDYLHLSGIDYIVKDIDKRIKEGVDFVKKLAE